jgi:hypothetical protein
VRAFIGYVVLAIVALFVIVGAVQVGTFLFGLVRQTHVPASVLAPVSDFVKRDVIDQLSAWLLVIVTGFLWWSTRVLSQGTRAQTRAQAPILELAVTLDDQPLLPGTGHENAYNQGWHDEDDRNIQLLPFIQNHSPRYVRLRVINVQTNPYGVAGKIRGKIVLLFGATNDVAPHPFNMVRDFTIEAIGAMKYVEAPIFNVGTLPNFTAAVTELTYADFQGIELRSAYGVTRLWQRFQGGPIPFLQIFEPGKGERR